ncbi:MAG: SoxR reducing system RseC family protein [Bacteroidales bacterium]|nr:SoxR reducing system RseC family protein [Bacteroidales bacterium]MBN2757626.1 SoxR reducing system RseC family protein [Bacteroidales bacterium]
MSNNKTIEHKGIVKKINDKSIIVSIITNSACLSCQVKGSCNLSEIEEKEIEVLNFNNSYKIGENVEVFFKESLGFRALFLAYILPFLIVLSVLIIGKISNLSEGLSGLLSLASLIPYFTIIYFIKNKLKETFSFSIKKTESDFVLNNAELKF